MLSILGDIVVRLSLKIKTYKKFFYGSHAEAKEPEYQIRQCKVVHRDQIPGNTLLWLPKCDKAAVLFELKLKYHKIAIVLENPANVSLWDDESVTVRAGRFAWWNGRIISTGQKL